MDVDPYFAAALLWRLKRATFERVRPITKLDRVPSLRWLEARKTNCTAFFPAFEEGGKCAVQPLHHLIGDDRRHIRVGGFVVPLILLIDVQVLAGRLEMRFP